MMLRMGHGKLQCRRLRVGMDYCRLRYCILWIEWRVEKWDFEVVET